MSSSLIDRNNVATSSQAIYFKDASHRGLLFAGGIFALIALCAALAKGTEINYSAAFIPAVLALFFVLLALWRLFIGTGPHWLLAIDNGDVYVNLGYNTGYSASQKGFPILFLTRDEINYVGGVREILCLSNRLGVTRYHHGYVDIRLKNPVHESVVRICQDANDMYAISGKSGPFPVRFVTPCLLRMNWNALIPAESVALNHFSRYMTVINTKEVKFPDWDELDSMQRDIYLDELWSMGMCEEVLFIARIHLKVSSATARKFMQERAAGYRKIRDI